MIVTETTGQSMSVLENAYSRTRERIPTAVYERLRDFILGALGHGRELTFTDLLETAVNNGQFLDLGENLSWFLLKVKQDLQARKAIHIRKMEGTRHTQVISLPRPLRRLR